MSHQTEVIYFLTRSSVQRHVLLQVAAETVTLKYLRQELSLNGRFWFRDTVHGE